MRKRALNTVVSPALPVAGLVSVDAATLLKKIKKNTRGDDNLAKQIGIGVLLFK
jgi:hypothetical protein